MSLTIILLAVPACGDSCEELKDAALACQHSGFTEDNIDQLECSDDRSTNECRIEVYEEECASEKDVFEGKVECDLEASFR